MNNSSLNPYKVLKIPYDASEECIEATCERLLLEYFPERNNDKSSAEHYFRVLTACNELKNPVQREFYQQNTEEINLNHNIPAFQRCFIALVTSLLIINTLSSLLGFKLNKYNLSRFWIESSAIILICWGLFFVASCFIRGTKWVMKYIVISSIVYFSLLCWAGNALAPYRSTVPHHLWPVFYVTYGAIFFIGFVLGVFLLNSSIFKTEKSMQ